MHDASVVDACHHIFVTEYETPGVRHHVNCEPWKVMLCGYSLSVTKNVPLQSGKVLIKGEAIQVCVRAMQEASVPSSHLVGEIKILQKKKNLFKKIWKP